MDRKDKPREAYKYKIGDFVQLRSGGPKMTVGALPMNSFARDYSCQWFSGGGKLNEGHFNEDSLIPYVEESE